MTTTTVTVTLPWAPGEAPGPDRVARRCGRDHCGDRRPGRAGAIVTEGDRSSGRSRQLGGTGCSSPRSGARCSRASVDLAVHSYKDLPTAPEPGLTLAAVPAREDLRDALVGPRRPHSASCRPAPRSAPVHPAGSPSCARSASAWRSSRSGATSTPASAGWRAGGRATWTPSCSRAPGWPGSAGSPRSPRPSTPPGAAGSRAGRPRRRVPPSDARPATRRPARGPAARACVVAERSTLAALEAGCSAPVAAYARSPRATTAPNCSSAPR